MSGGASEECRVPRLRAGGWDVQRRQRQQTVFQGRRQVETLERWTWWLLQSVFMASVVDPGLRSSVRMSEETPSNHVRMAFPQTYVARVCRSASRRHKRQKGAKGGRRSGNSGKRGVVQGHDFDQFTEPANARLVPGAPGRQRGRGGAGQWRPGPGGRCRWMTRMALGPPCVES